MTDTHSAPADASPDSHVPAEEALDHLHAADRHPSQVRRVDLSVEEAARSILTRSVHIGTGNLSLSPRPGQVTMIGDIVSAITRPDNDGQAACIGPTGVGKALDLNTPIPTPTGRTRMGDLAVGDQVFDETGAICQVTHAHPVRHDRDCYEVVFSDGSSIIADAEHLWATQTRALRAKQAERRRAERGVRKNSVARYERYLKISALAGSIQGSGSLHSLASASVLTAGLIGRYDLEKFRRRAYPGVSFSQGEKFDLRPVLALAVAGLKSRSALAQPEPPAYEVVTTVEMAASVRGQGGALNHAIPTPGPLDMPDADLLVDPYVLGAWLGDGNTDTGGFTSADPEIIDEIRSRGYVVEKTSAKYRWSIHLSTGRATNRWVDTFAKHLGVMDVRGNKHIPDSYLRGSHSQRLDLLRGLMDTDGTVSTQSGRCEFSVCDETLARGAMELVASLGMIPRISSGPATITEDDPERPGKKRRRIVGTRWRVGFIPNEQVFALPRKAALVRENSRRGNQRYVTSVTKVESRPVRCITVDSPSHLFLAGERMVPTHNSLVYLSAAAASWSVTGRRSVISTESLALQAQITDKDAPTVARAAADVTGLAPQVAVLKGWSNYICSAATVEAGNSILEEQGRVGDGKPGALAKKFTKAREAAATKAGARKAPVRNLFGSDEPDAATLAAEKADLVAWALDQVNDHGKPGVTGDKNSYPGNLSDSRSWESVSVASGDCLGADRCPFADQCLPRLAREKAADADIIVTNHTLLGVQTANDIPVVIGSKTLGQFDHLFIDEAHGLPSTVRNQGSVEVSSRAIKTVARILERTLDDTDKSVKALLDAAVTVAEYVGDDLDTLGKQTSRRDPVVRLKAEQSPLENSETVLERWLKQASELLKKAKKGNNSHAAEIALRRAESRVAGLANALELVCEDKPGSARWVEVVTPHTRAADQSMYAVARYTPVDVAPMLRYSLYSREMTDEEMEDTGYSAAPSKAQMAIIAAGGTLGENTAPDGPAPRKPLSVVALSATLPAGFTRQAGLKAQPVAYPSPFDTAYGNSVLFVPRTTSPDDIKAVSSNKWGSQKFDTEMHRAWACAHMVSLVAANGGSALILSATAASGKVYAEALQRAAAGRWQVLSQWNGTALRRNVEAWKADTNAVMVGTRSLMTGVDASGETCTLVVIDRPPRAASNPVDDARVDMLVNDAQFDRYTADRLVYVSDAGELLEQGAGRLIRSVNDSGMVAVLDPRLLKSSPFAYKPPVRNAYLDTLHRFEERIADPAAALAWLESHRDARSATAKAMA